MDYNLLTLLLMTIIAGTGVASIVFVCMQGEKETISNIWGSILHDPPILSSHSMKSKVTEVYTDEQVDRMSDPELILKIAKNMRSFGEATIIDMYTRGYCLQWAEMVCAEIEDAYICYIPEMKHYIVCCQGRYFDITGELHITNPIKQRFQKGRLYGQFERRAKPLPNPLPGCATNMG